jgi:hypothetical protein
MLRYKVLIGVCLALMLSAHSFGQYVHIDSVAVTKPKLSRKDSLALIVKPHRDPQKATLRSAIIPGWGQIYNHKYWKVPLVYGALVTCGFIFNYNLQQYKLYRHVYQVVIAAENGDSTQYHTIDTIYYQFSPADIQYARNEARQYVDYSVLAFIILWGLNVVDATVDAHLHEFDVTDNLTLQLNPASKWQGGLTGVSLVLDIHKTRHKLSPLLIKPIF